MYRGVGADCEKPKKIFSANNKQGSLNRGKKWFSEKLRKSFDLEIFGPSRSRDVPPVSGTPASELVLQRDDLPSEITLPGETSSPKLCNEG